MIPILARFVVRSFLKRNPSREAFENVAPREEKVLHHVLRGLLTKQIADQLGVTVETMRQHLKNIYTRIHGRSRAEAAMKFHGHG